MSAGVVLLASSPRVAPGLLSWPAWEALRSRRVYAGDAAHPLLPALAGARVAVEVLDAPTAHVADTLAAAAPALWLAGRDGDPALVTAVGERGVAVDVLPGSWDLPGARLLDVVAVMDRLRSPGGCPWDAEQTHESLAPYLLEEAYEAYAVLEEGDLDALREELGDVLLQVAFHARLAEELPAGERWSIDDLAADLVAKLVRRHPHVFAATHAPTAADVATNWDRIKAAEKGRRSVTEGVPLGQPALALAAKLQARAARANLPTGLHEDAAGTAAQEVAAAAARTEETLEPVDAVGDLLFHAVTLARQHGVDPEAALRGTARRYRQRLLDLESAGEA